MTLKCWMVPLNTPVFASKDCEPAGSQLFASEECSRTTWSKPSNGPGRVIVAVIGMANWVPSGPRS
jgi:hypothetical protein